MKTKIQLAVALIASCICAPFRGANTVALANAAPPAPPAPPKPGESKDNPGQQASQSELVRENAELRLKVASLEAAQPKNAAAIQEKMAAGLSREQAEAAVTHQGKFTKLFKEAAIGAKK